MKCVRLLICFVVIFYSVSVSANDCRVTILHFNDLHGHLEAPNKGLGGAARIGSLVIKIEQENIKSGRHTLLLMGGDLFSGTPVSNEFEGGAELKFLEAIGTEAMVLGNHEFDFGVKNLKKKIKSTQMPILAANVIDKTTERLLGMATYVFPLAPGCRVGLMGLVTKTTPNITNADVSSLTFKDPIKVAGDYIDDLLEQSEIQIALTHLRRIKDIELAKRVEGFDLVVGGHDHVSPQDYCKLSAGISVCETPPSGTYLGRIDLRVSGGKVVTENTQLIPIDKKAGKSKEVKKLLEPYFSKVSSSMDEVVGALGANLYHRPKQGIASQVPLGIAVADAIKQYVKADVAFMNTGGVRKTLKKGKITKGDVFEALPFQNYVGVIELSGEDLTKIVDRSEKSVGSGHAGPYLNWSGLKYKKLGGSYEILVNGTAINPGKTYKVATVDFIAKGGDGYGMLKKKKFSSSGKLVRDVFEKYLKSSK
jgi:2',3'-cyclic-nucleotide 2'-phosphodiesterase (5'-nucleotidase family)